MTPGLLRHDVDEANDDRAGRCMGKIKSSGGWLVGNGTEKSQWVQTRFLEVSAVGCHLYCQQYSSTPTPLSSFHSHPCLIVCSPPPLFSRANGPVLLEPPRLSNCLTIPEEEESNSVMRIDR